MAFGGGGESYCVSAIIAGAGEISCSNGAHIMFITSIQFNTYTHKLNHFTF